MSETTATPANTITPENTASNTTAITIEIPGLKLTLSGIAALIIFLGTITLICATTLYVITWKSENLSSVIKSLNPKSDATDGNSTKSELLQFFIPTSTAYEKNHPVFEAWLTDNTGWWAKTPMTNIRTINGKKVVVTGFWYQTQDPTPGGQLENNQYGNAIQNRALKMLGVTDLDSLWMELQNRELQ